MEKKSWSKCRWLSQGDVAASRNVPATMRLWNLQEIILGYWGRVRVFVCFFSWWVGVCVRFCIHCRYLSMSDLVGLACKP